MNVNVKNNEQTVEQQKKARLITLGKSFIVFYLLSSSWSESEGKAETSSCDCANFASTPFHVTRKGGL
jgi:hypothetical protein